MRMRTAALLAGGMIAVAPLLYGAVARGQDIVSDDFAAPYLQRIDGVTADAGDAKEVNAAIHIVDPWPRHANRRQIPANGERMAGAVERYRDVRKLPLTPPPISSVQTGGSGPSGLTGAAIAPAGGSGAR